MSPLLWCTPHIDDQNSSICRRRSKNIALLNPGGEGQPEAEPCHETCNHRESCYSVFNLFEAPHRSDEEADGDERLEGGREAPDSRQVNDGFAFYDGGP